MNYIQLKLVSGKIGPPMRSFLAGANLVFEQDSESKKEKLEDTSVLYEQIGRLQMDIAFLKKKL